MAWSRGVPDLTLFGPPPPVPAAVGKGPAARAWYARLRCAAVLELRTAEQGQGGGGGFKGGGRCVVWAWVLGLSVGCCCVYRSHA